MSHQSIKEILNGKISLKHFSKYFANCAKHRQDNLIKPNGSLGKLEEYAIWMAGWQRTRTPTINNPLCLVFAANHGVANRGVSAYPQAVTGQMVKNFKDGGAAINQLCKLANVKLSVEPIELEKPTKDFSKESAMTLAETELAMQKGFDCVPNDIDLLILGEMGISNTSSATAISCALFNQKVDGWTGLGTGLKSKNLKKKISVITRGLALHGKKFDKVEKIFSAFGGREMAAIAGAIVAARLYGIPVLLDGFISTASAAPLTIFKKDILNHCLISHLSTEPGHLGIIRKLKKDPILNLKLRLGEASGAVIATMILKSAIVTHNGMSTFSEAKVSKKK